MVLRGMFISKVFFSGIQVSASNGTGIHLSVSPMKPSKAIST